MEVLTEFDLTSPEWHVMSRLRVSSADHRSSPGELAADLELSSGAMTSRLDRLEQKGFIRRLPDPEDRRGDRRRAHAGGEGRLGSHGGHRGAPRGVLRLGIDEDRAAAAEQAAAQADARVRGARALAADGCAQPGVAGAGAERVERLWLPQALDAVGDVLGERRAMLEAVP